MTLEEEKSDLALNKHLTAKIIDLENQINEKQNKYEKLKKERQDFKTNCINSIEDMDNEIKMLQENTENDLKQLEEQVNTSLNEIAKESGESAGKLKERLNGVIERLEKKKLDNAEEEKKLIEAYNAAEGQVRTYIDEYDKDMEMFKELNDNLSKENNTLKVEMASKKNNRDRLKEEFETTEIAHKKHLEKVNEMNYANEVKVRASEWIQAQFKGFWIRKSLRKKYKFLAALKKPKIEPPNPNDKKNPKKR